MVRPVTVNAYSPPQIQTQPAVAPKDKTEAQVP